MGDFNNVLYVYHRESSFGLKDRHVAVSDIRLRLLTNQAIVEICVDQQFEKEIEDPSASGKEQLAAKPVRYVTCD